MRRLPVIIGFLLALLGPRIVLAENGAKLPNFVECLEFLKNEPPALRTRFEMAWGQTTVGSEQRRQLVQAIEDHLKTRKAARTGITTTGAVAGGALVAFLGGGTIGRIVDWMGPVSLGRASVHFAHSSGPALGFVLGAAAAAYVTSKVLSPPLEPVLVNASVHGLSQVLDRMGVPQERPGSAAASDPDFDGLRNTR